ncbi:hypothetical protein ACFSTC_07045 [Nonomuraea ferruginea]
MQPPPYIPPQVQFPPDPQTKREPFIPGARPGQALQRSAAYGVAGAMLLIIMIVLAARAPVLVTLVSLPVAVLLRAADLAQPELITRRPTGAAALDVIRVFAYPKALVKSVAITLALIPYALILGLPVTLLLTVMARHEPVQRAGLGCRGGPVDGVRRPRSRGPGAPDAQDALIARTLENSGDGDGGSVRGDGRAHADPRHRHIRGQREEGHMDSGERRARGRSAAGLEGGDSGDDAGTIAMSAGNTQTPERLGPYRLVRKIGEGGMGGWCTSASTATAARSPSRSCIRTSPPT